MSKLLEVLYAKYNIRCPGTNSNFILLPFIHLTVVLFANLAI